MHQNGHFHTKAMFHRQPQGTIMIRTFWTRPCRDFRWANAIATQWMIWEKMADPSSAAVNLCMAGKHSKNNLVNQDVLTKIGQFSMESYVLGMIFQMSPKPSFRQVASQFNCLEMSLGTAGAIIIWSFDTPSFTSSSLGGRLKVGLEKCRHQHDC